MTIEARANFWKRAVNDVQEYFNKLISENKVHATTHGCGKDNGQLDVDGLVQKIIFTVTHEFNLEIEVTVDNKDFYFNTDFDVLEDFSNREVFSLELNNCLDDDYIYFDIVIKK